MTNSNSVSPLVHLLAGGLAGSVGAVVTCPLEVAKTRLQSSYYRPSAAELSQHRHGVLSAAASHVRSTVGFLQRIAQTEGVLALWRGVGPTLLGVIPSRSIQFGAYNQSKQYLTRVYGKETSTVHLCSAIVAGIATVTTMSPVWFIKTRMQLQNSKGDVGARYRNSWDCLMKVVRNEGPLTLYRGLSASLVGVSEGTIQWVLYERMKRSVNAYNARHHDSASAGKLQWLQYFGCAASAKLLAAAITYPHEVIRTRLRESPVVSVSFTSRLAAPSSAAHMVSSALSGYPTLSPSTTALRHHHTTRTMTNTYKYSGFVQTGRLIVQEEGVAALYSGMTAHLMRVVPNAAIMFVCYEGVVHFAKTFYDD